MDYTFSHIKMNAIGDSITRGTYTAQGESIPASIAEKPWCSVVAEKLGFESVENYGINGTSISSTSSVNIENAFSLRFDKMRDDADLVVVAGGTNDFGTNVKLGSANDTHDVSFCGGLHVLCKGLKEKYPSAKVVFIQPIYRSDKETNDNQNTLSQYRQAIKEIAHGIYGFFVIDTDIPEFCERSQELFPDGVHPTPEGHQIYGEYIAQKIAAILQ